MESNNQTIKYFENILKLKIEFVEKYHLNMNSDEFHESLDEIIKLRQQIDLLKQADLLK